LPQRHRHSRKSDSPDQDFCHTMPNAHATTPSKKSMLLLSRLLLSSGFSRPEPNLRANLLDSELRNINREDFDELVALASSNHVIMRGLAIFANGMRAVN